MDSLKITCVLRVTVDWYNVTCRDIEVWLEVVKIVLRVISSLISKNVITSKLCWSSSEVCQFNKQFSDYCVFFVIMYRKSNRIGNHRIPNSFQRLCEFLYKVQTYSDSNRMDLNNLAIVFSPTILKNNSGNLDLEMRDIQKLKKVTEVCVM